MHSGSSNRRHELLRLLAHCKLAGVDGHTLGSVVRFVNANEPVSQFKHIVSEADDDELRILCPLLYVVGNNGDVLVICTTTSSVHRFPESRLALRMLKQVMVGVQYADVDYSSFVSSALQVAGLCGHRATTNFITQQHKGCTHKDECACFAQLARPAEPLTVAAQQAFLLLFVGGPTQGSIDLIHDVKWRRLVPMQGKH